MSFAQIITSSLSIWLFLMYILLHDKTYTQNQKVSSIYSITILYVNIITCSTTSLLQKKIIHFFYDAWHFFSKCHFVIMFPLSFLTSLFYLLSINQKNCTTLYYKNQKSPILYHKKKVLRLAFIQ